MKKMIKCFSAFMCTCLLLGNLSVKVIATEEATDINASSTENSVSVDENITEKSEEGKNEATDTEDMETEKSESESTEQTQEAEKEETVVGSPDTFWLILEDYSVLGERLITGEDSVVSLTIKNTNTKLDATNVMVSISSMEYAILPKSGLSNQFFVDTIPAKESKTIEIPISVSDSAVGNHDLRIAITYSYLIEKDEKKIETKFTNEMTVVLQVYLASVVTQKLSLSPSGNELEVEYKNTGARDVYNVTAHVSGDMSGTENFFLGNISAENEGKANIPVTFLSGGNKNIKINYSYTNDRGVSIQSDVESFLVSAIKTMDSPVGNKELVKEERAVSNSLVIILLICLSAIIVTVVFGRKSWKAK